MKLSRRHAIGAAASLASLPRWAAAQSRAATLRYVTGNTINTLDATAYGTTRESFGLSMNVYDRLFRFGRKRYGADWIFDADTIEGELAQSYGYSPDRLTITITLRPDATWHDGSPVTVEDIKWSLDRAVAAKSLAPPQLSTGSLTSTEQFRITGDHTLEVSLPKPDRLALANLCVPYAIMVNSKLAKQHATEADPWAQEWMKAAAPTPWRAPTPAKARFRRATRPGRVARSPASPASSCKPCRSPPPAPISSSAAMPTWLLTCPPTTSWR